ncbi:hypothetical protein [Amycolatopsis pigmentata]|uniref:Uncharacterized protein n=1 Tax=Amycolatopsis pigmentata TaxID=450801 RepID=A0ABW5FV93_9PSEU
MSSPRVASPAVVTKRLQDLVARGYRFVHRTDAEGRVLSVLGIRPHHTVVDVVCLNAEDDVVATRVPGGEVDVLEPAKVLWRRDGDARTVLEDLLALPDSAEAPEGRPVAGCWIRTESGRATWVAAQN